MSIFKRRDEPRAAEPVKIAWAPHQAQAEMIEQILADEGIPCLIKRNRGMDVPDFLAAGSRDIFVPASAVERATELLAELEASGERLPGS